MRHNLSALSAWVTPGALVLAIFAAACSGPEVRTEKAQNSDLTQNMSFSWAPQKQQEQSRELSLRPDTILDQDIKSSVAQDLRNKGYQAGDQASPIQIAYSIKSRDRLKSEMSSAGPDGGPFYSSNLDGYETTYIQKQGSMVLDFIDSKTGQLLWRGVAVTDVGETGISQSDVQKMVDQILEKFPSRIGTSTG